MHDAENRCPCALGERRKRRESPPNGMVFMRVNVAGQMPYNRVEDDQVRADSAREVGNRGVWMEPVASAV